MNLIKIFLIIFVLCFSQSGMCGGWVSGGADNIGDTQNPWFIQTTDQVRYCINFSEQEVTISRSNFEEVFKRALSDWHIILKSYYARKSGAHLLYRAGLQDWVAVSCNENPDVKVAVGWNGLTSLEKKYLGQNDQKHQHISEVIRTSYDQVLLRGKGIIFVGSDIGQNAFNIESTQIARPWSNPKLLYLVLMHELGHVNGFPHLSNAIFPIDGSSLKWLMSARFPEMILEKVIWGPQGSFSGPITEGIGELFDPKAYKACNIQPALKNLFGMPEASNCLEFHPKMIKEVGLISHIDVLWSTATGSQQKTIKGGSLIPAEGFSVLEEAMSILFLPSAQKVVSSIPFGIPFINGPGLFKAKGMVNYKRADGSVQKIFILIENGNLHIVGYDSEFKEINSILAN